MKIISMGAGVQSSVMAILSAEGKFGSIPDCAIFADTQWEPKSIYEHLEFLKTILPFPVYTVTAGNLREDLINGVNSTGQKFITIPAFTKKGMGRRQCTKEYKIMPVKKKIRELLGVGYRKRVPKGTEVELWLGISTDEIQRMKDSSFKYIIHKFPLIDNHLSRNDCIQIWTDRYPNKPLIKSACIGCPYQPTKYWLEMKQNDQVSWENAVEVDNAIRNLRSEELFLHRSCIPLSDIKDTAEKEDGFLGECDGLCDT